MNRVALASMMVVLTLTHASSQNTTPFAQPGSAANTMPHSLGDVMTVIQLRHIKLWYAA